MFKTPVLVDAITRHLSEHGGMTCKELADDIGWDARDVHKALRRMRKDGPKRPKRVYISRYTLDSHCGEKRYPRPVFALGNLPDAKKINTKNKEYQRARRAESRKKVAGLLNSVFMLGIPLKQRLNNPRKSRASTICPNPEA